jgi:hypothetical protein
MPKIKLHHLLNITSHVVILNIKLHHLFNFKSYCLLNIMWHYSLNIKWHRFTSLGIAQSFVLGVNLPATLFTFGSKPRAKSFSSVVRSEVVC